MAHDSKYGRVTTEFGKIGEDEPVFLLRGRDKFLPDVLAYYYQLASSQGLADHAAIVEHAREQLLKWQASNPERVESYRHSAGQPGLSYWERNK